MALSELSERCYRTIGHYLSSVLSEFTIGLSDRGSASGTYHLTAYCYLVLTVTPADHQAKFDCGRRPGVGT